MVCDNDVAVKERLHCKSGSDITRKAVTTSRQRSACHLCEVSVDDRRCLLLRTHHKTVYTTQVKWDVVARRTFAAASIIYRPM